MRPEFPFPAWCGGRDTAFGSSERYRVRFRWELAVEQNDKTPLVRRLIALD